MKLSATLPAFIKKLFRLMVLTVLFLLLLIISTLNYLLNSAGGSQLLISFVERFYPQLHVIESSGDLFHGMEFKKLTVSPWVEIDDLSLKLNGRCLFIPKVCVEYLKSSRMQVNSVQKKTKNESVLELPAIILPIPVELKAFEIQKLVIHAAENDVDITNVQLAATATLSSVDIHSAHALYDGFDANLHGKISLLGDYPLAAIGHIVHANSNTRIELKVADSVKKLNLQADIEQKGSLHIVGTIEPLNPLLPVELKAHSDGVFDYVLAADKADKNVLLDQLSLAVKGDLNQLRLNGGINIAGTAVPKAHAKFQAVLHDKKFSVNNVLLQTLGGEVNAQGELKFFDAIEWSANWQLKDIQTQIFWPDIESLLNGEGHTDGKIKGKDIRYLVQINQLTGSWRNYELNAKGSIGQENNVWKLDDVSLQLGNNSVRLVGSLNHEWNLTGTIDAPNLRAFWPTLYGEVNGQFSLIGEPNAPSITADLVGKKLVFNTLRAKSISMKAAIERLAEQKSNFLLHFDELEAAGLSFGQVDLSADGERKNHAVALAINSPATASKANLTGQWDGKSWEGALQSAAIQFKAAALSDWTLVQPLPMSWKKKTGFSIDAFCWQHSSAKLCSDGPIVLGPKGKLAVNLQGLKTEWLEPHFPDGFHWLATLNINANVAWDPLSTTKADIEFLSTPGLIRLDQSGAAPLEFAYSQFSGDSTLKNNQLENQVVFKSESLGQLESNVGLSIQQQGDRTIDGKIALEGLKLKILKPFYSKIENLEGVLSANGKVAGTVSNPKFIGKINLTDGRLTAETLPLPISNCQFEANLYGDNATLNGQFKSGEGVGNLVGSLVWAPQLKGNFNLTGSNLTLKPARGLKMIVQPDIKATIDANNIALSGKVDVSDGKLTAKALPVDAIEESSDTVFVGEQHAKPSAIKITSDILITIADKFTFTGFGAEGKLKGDMHIKQQPEQELPRADGEINIVDGKYTAYGQRLNVRTGRIIFGGPVDLPSVQVEAIRQIEDITVGIRIFGRVDQPTLTLFSEPSLPEETALSYLITGRPPSAAASTQSNNYMGQAAVALGVMGGEGVARDVAEKMGVSDFSLSSDTTTDGKQLVSVAGYISPKLYVRYGMGVFEPGNTVTLRYNLTPKLYLEAVNGLQSALDLIYSFDIGKKQVAQP